jgi:hypothetical protein
MGFFIGGWMTNKIKASKEMTKAVLDRAKKVSDKKGEIQKELRKIRIALDKIEKHLTDIV